LSGPIDIVRCFHNAFRRDISQIDDTVDRIARDSGNFTSVLDRLHTMNEILNYHAMGEEAAVFPAMDKVAPEVATAYLMDHRELDNMVMIWRQSEKILIL
jgi:iron-sulfur cluster repair protein YtfE (RIC family)